MLYLFGPENTHKVSESEAELQAVTPKIISFRAMQKESNGYAGGVCIIPEKSQNCDSGVLDSNWHYLVPLLSIFLKKKKYLQKDKGKVTGLQFFRIQTNSFAEIYLKLWNSVYSITL